MRKQITIMAARKMRKQHDAGVTVTDIASEFGCTRKTVYATLAGTNMAAQRRKADRADAMLGGVLGPGTGNYRRLVVPNSKGTDRTDMWQLGLRERTAPDPLDLLMLAEEEEMDE